MESDLKMTFQQMVDSRLKKDLEELVVTYF